MVRTFCGIFTYPSSVRWRLWWQQIMFTVCDLVTSFSERIDLIHNYCAGMFLPVWWQTEGWCKTLLSILINAPSVENWWPLLVNTVTLTANHWCLGQKKNMVQIHVQVLWMPGKKSWEKSYLENSEVFVYSGKFRKPRHMSKVRCVIRNTREGFKCLSWSLVSMQIWLIVELFSAKANLQSMGEGSLICFMICSFCCSRICLPKHCLNTCSCTKASVTTLNNKYRLWKNLEKRH